MEGLRAEGAEEQQGDQGLSWEAETGGEAEVVSVGTLSLGN